MSSICSTAFVSRLKSNFKSGLLALSLVAPAVGLAKVSYRTSFGKCPARSTGALTLKLVRAFEANQSLISLKRAIVEEKLQDRHFLSDYKIEYHPLKGLLELSFNCPTPIMKAQIYKNNGQDSYEAILVDTGALVDPTYEVLLRDEHKLTQALPTLALPVGDMEKDVQLQIARLVRNLKWDFRKYLSELILDEKKDLTIILSIQGHPSSVFMGKGDWEEKVDKLRKVIDHMLASGRLPAVINMTNAKKVVVKFSDKT